MEDTHAQENAELLAPYIVERNELAHECLAAMLENRHEEAGRLLASYQMACLAVETSMQICQWFDAANGSWPEEIVVDQAKEQAPREAENTE
jgi:hypothetical protein